MGIWKSTKNAHSLVFTGLERELSHQLAKQSAKNEISKLTNHVRLQEYQRELDAEAAETLRRLEDGKETAEANRLIVKEALDKLNAKN